MRYSTRFFIYSLLCGLASAYLYVHPIKNFYYALSIGSVPLTLNKLFVMTGIFFVVLFFVIGIFVRSKERR